MSKGHSAQAVDAKAVILATGAQERPVPFPGWTLPGVLTVGAAQILLKSAGQIPAEPVWIVGSGPLPLLYAVQLVRAGGRIAGYLDTTPSGQWRASLKHLPRALRAVSDLFKGAGWLTSLRASKTLMVSGVSALEAIGTDRVEAIRYRSKDGTSHFVKAGTVLVHEGIVPNIHPALSLDCAMAWNNAQECFAPSVDSWGETSQANLFVAGDGAGIAGAKAAKLRGELAGIRVAEKLGRLSNGDAAVAARGMRKALTRELATRPFLDALYRPRPEIFTPPDATIVCRCEEVTAGEVRACGRIGQPGPNQLKAATRTGMGPCQGRQCGYTITRLLAAEQSRTPAEIGFFHIRPPLKPVTLAELASLAPTEAA
jgi:NADPH-dependent 2,4-dienoyl-CoA reductase/sulfur reductase-like enzyme